MKNQGENNPNIGVPLKTNMTATHAAKYIHAQVVLTTDLRDVMLEKLQEFFCSNKVEVHIKDYPGDNNSIIVNLRGPSDIILGMINEKH